MNTNGMRRRIDRLSETVEPKKEDLWFPWRYWEGLTEEERREIEARVTVHVLSELESMVL